MNQHYGLEFVLQCSTEEVERKITELKRKETNEKQISSIYVDQANENENVFGVKVFLGDPEKPTAVIDLKTISHDSALKLFRTIETHVLKPSVRFSLAEHVPEIMKMIEETED